MSGVVSLWGYLPGTGQVEKGKKKLRVGDQQPVIIDIEVQNIVMR